MSVSDRGDQTCARVESSASSNKLLIPDEELVTSRSALIRKYIHARQRTLGQPGICCHSEDDKSETVEPVHLVCIRMASLMSIRDCWHKY